MGDDARDDLTQPLEYVANVERAAEGGQKLMECIDAGIRSDRIDRWNHQRHLILRLEPRDDARSRGGYTCLQPGLTQNRPRAIHASHSLDEWVAGESTWRQVSANWEKIRANNGAISLDVKFV